MYVHVFTAARPSPTLWDKLTEVFMNFKRPCSYQPREYVFSRVHVIYNVYLGLYLLQLSNQIAERVDNIFHVFVDNIVSIVYASV